MGWPYCRGIYFSGALSEALITAVNCFCQIASLSLWECMYPQHVALCWKKKDKKNTIVIIKPIISSLVWLEKFQLKLESVRIYDSSWSSLAHAILIDKTVIWGLYISNWTFLMWGLYMTLGTSYSCLLHKWYIWFDCNLHISFFTIWLFKGKCCTNIILASLFLSWWFNKGKLLFDRGLGIYWSRVGIYFSCWVLL